MRKIDLRSDTVTQPTDEMRKAMAEAEVGDDVLDEDPTINRLQELSAEIMGKEAALFIPSGTMGNLAAVLSHCGRGDEAIMGNRSHTFLNEVGGLAALGGVHPCPIENQPDGTLKITDIQESIRSKDVHHPDTRLIILENTQNQCGGMPLSVEYTKRVGDLAKNNDIRLHLDGARIFNACAAINVKPSDLAAPADSVTFCLSKGLAAPVGSVLCGSMDFITRAKRIRKQLGGGMRQAGIIAAAGIVALRKMPEQLSRDHLRARALAEGLSGISGLELENPQPATNMVYARIPDGFPINAPQLDISLSKKGIYIDVEEPRRIRVVTHYHISDEDIRNTISSFANIFSTLVSTTGLIP